MKKINRITVMAAALMALLTFNTSCANSVEKNTDLGEMKTEKRNVTGFNGVTVEGSPKVYYTQGNSFDVTVKAKEKLIADIETVKDGDGNLVVSYKGKQRTLIGDDIVIYVTSPSIDDIVMSGSGDFISEKAIKADELNVVLVGSGDIKLQGKVTCKNIISRVTGSGDLNMMDVEAVNSDIALTGSGDLNVSQHNVDKTTVSLVGSGDIRVVFDNCNSAVSNLAGSGDISMKGTLKSLTKNKNGSGDYSIDIRE